MSAGPVVLGRKLRLVSALVALAWLPAGVSLADDALPGFELPTPAAVVVSAPPDSPMTTAVVEPSLDLPEPPSVVVTMPEPVRAAEAAPVVAPIADPLAAAIQARLADPALPLPPRFSGKDREALAAAYAGRSFKPIWIAEFAWNPAATAAAGRLGRADEDGLDPAAYPVPDLSGGGSRPNGADLAEAELKLSAAAFLYARDARGGRLDPVRLSALITPKLSLPSIEVVLSTLSAAPDADVALQGFNPAYPGYRALRERLAAARAHRPAGVARTSARGGVVLASTSADPGPLRGWTPRLEGDLLANMERWRWLPAEVAPRYVAVNIPEFRLRVMDAGSVMHETRVVTGRPDTPTPVFSGTMDHVIVNPSWFIPPSILKKEILPGLARDPNYAAKRGYSVVRRGNVTTVRQPPGPRNALGYIKFMFPNDHAVYLHDTPSRHLFASAQRAFSHGCVRVENPFALGGAILSPTWTEARLKSLIGSGERTITLTEKLPVHLTYFTLSVDEFGDLKSFDDVYGYHRRVRTALGLGA